MKLLGGFIAVAVLVVLMFSCKPRERINCGYPVCTGDIRTVRLKISTPLINALPILIDVYDSNSSAFVLQNIAEDKTYQSHIIAGDATLQWFAKSNTSEKFRVDVKRGGSVLKTLPFELIHDCCHIGKVSGADSLLVP
jgi:hypothetical protein